MTEHHLHRQSPGKSTRTTVFGVSAAFAFVFTMGIVNLFGDITYEGGAAINGQFLHSLGAGAAMISIIAGAGEFLGYALRSVAGWTADKSGKYWPLTIAGFVINLFAVPAMALAANWQVAGLLILAERTGRAIRKPTVEAMLSYTTAELGTGWVYALNTALDETGATIGPFIIGFAAYRHTGYRQSYAILLISALLAFVALVIARMIFPVPSRIGAGSRTAKAERFTPAFWIYMIGAACFGAGLMSFELIAFHLSTHRTASDLWIPMMLGIATGFGVLANLVLGKLYDRNAIRTIIGAVLVSAFFSPLVFLGGFAPALAGMLLWGVGYAVQDTLFKAVVADRLPERRLNFAFGIFYTGYGVGWLIGSIAIGLLYETSIAAVIAFSMAVQLGSIPIFLFARHKESAS
jgi:MFS family permease